MTKSYFEELGARVAYSEKRGLFEWRPGLDPRSVCAMNARDIERLLFDFERSDWAHQRSACRGKKMRWRGRYLRRHGA